MQSDNKFRELGFKCGLEIHQQLLTDRKLFCRCPAHYRNDKPDGEIIRHMRPTLSELGEYDGTALMEFKTKKNVIYQLYRDNACTYEMDDTPPFPINRQALEIALKLAMLFNCALVDELHVSRKQYLDGSIPAGFQRTSIVGVDGWIPYKGRKISITHVCLEEDACREVLDSGHDIIFKTDRLSMPLLEIVTGPEMLTPAEAMEVDAIIGRVFKASGLVRRGIGSVRQDVNVSVRGGERVEIKGVPQTWMIEKLTSVEALRQAAMLKIRDILKERSVTDKNIQTEEFDIAKILEGRNIAVIEEALAGNKAVKALRLVGFEGIFGMQGQPGKTFADEVSGRLKVIACLDKYPNLATSDIPEQAGFNSEIWKSLRKACNCNAGDSLVVTWGSHSDVAMALSEIKLRAIDAIRGVPNETRQPMKDGMTDFERILPGPDRMYPDTDSPPVEISKDYMNKLKAELPEPAYLTEDRWQKQGAPRRIVEKCVVSQYSKLFDTIIGNSPLTSEVIWGALRTLRLKDRVELSEKSAGIVAVFKAFADGKISKDSMIDILKMLRPGGEIDIEKTINERRLLDIRDKAVQEVISEFIEETADCLFKCPENRIGYICGGVKKRLSNRVDGLMLQKDVTVKIK